MIEEVTNNKVEEDKVEEEGEVSASTIVAADEECAINVVDAICGSGKTSAAINMMNKQWGESQGLARFLYITPYLDEGERICKSCPNLNFKQPLKLGTKLEGIKILLENGENIVSTHALFRLLDKEAVELARVMGYTLIMDEVADVVETLDITNQDLTTILEKHARIRPEDNRIEWTDDNYAGKYEEYKQLIETGTVYCYSNVALIYTLPIEYFKAFKRGRIYILTYLFEHQIQKYYYDFYKMKYRYLGIENKLLGDSGFFSSNVKDTETDILNAYQFIEYDSNGSPIDKDWTTKNTQKFGYGYRIHITNNAQLNEIGVSKNTEMTALSHSWFVKNKRNSPIKRLKNNLYNYFRHIQNASSSEILWTTFIEFQSLLEGKGYKSSFLSCNARATNKYSDRVVLAYAANRFLDPYTKNFFTSKNIAVDEDAYALSELLQWIFRSAIRKGKPITIYVPSLRMRKLLEDWCKEN